jgi:hypothetical protein
MNQPYDMARICRFNRSLMLAVWQKRKTISNETHISVILYLKKSTCDESNKYVSLTVFAKPKTTQNVFLQKQR